MEIRKQENTLSTKKWDQEKTIWPRKKERKHALDQERKKKTFFFA